MRTVDPRPFRSTGWVVAGDAGTGVLQLGEELFYVPPGVSVTGVAVGVKATAIGHHDVGGRRWSRT